jgi:hypothetical protein
MRLKHLNLIVTMIIAVLNMLCTLLPVVGIILVLPLVFVLPERLQAISWAALLGLFTAVFSLLVVYLRRGAVMNGARPVRFRFTIYPWILFGLATVVAILAVEYSAIGAEQQPRLGLIQLWMLPAVQPGKSCAVRLGVRSFESASVTYRITMTAIGLSIYCKL